MASPKVVWFGVPIALFAGIVVGVGVGLLCLDGDSKLASVAFSLGSSFL